MRIGILLLPLLRIFPSASLNSFKESDFELKKEETSCVESNSGNTGTHGHGIGSIDDDSNERSGIVHSSKFGHGSVSGGGRGGGATGAADNSGDVQGGGAVVPVIVAGAAINHRPNNHHNAGSRHVNCMALPTLITATMAALIVH
ncbi:unnamed protein product [Dovyalis caffra]|uniref:Uncharacterized protein n=1 Tax=Dovyalis caffra TaxID=77055 RepID=A0AAV1QVV8_9ROSI|nr:unnamed protein product [Dovyalis caffra]